MKKFIISLWFYLRKDLARFIFPSVFEDLKNLQEEKDVLEFAVYDMTEYLTLNELVDDYSDWSSNGL